MNAGRLPKVLYFPITNLPVGVLLKARPQNRLLLLENIIVNPKYQHDRIPRLTCNRGKRCVLHNGYSYRTDAVLKS